MPNKYKRAAETLREFRRLCFDGPKCTDSKSADDLQLMIDHAELAAVLPEPEAERVLKAAATVPRHEHTMSLREQYAAVVLSVLNGHKLAQHVASKKIYWTDAVVDALAVEMANAHERGEGFAE